MKNKRLLQIVVPLVILIAIGGVWLLKDRAMGPRGDEMLPTDPEAAMEIQEVDIKALAAKGLPVMVDFGADACVPCIEMAPAPRGRPPCTLWMSGSMRQRQRASRCG